jgi:glutamate-1-semialdehyde 2,1-aminomutase
MQEGWKNLASLHNLKITLAGIPALSTYTFNSKDALSYKTLISQEMLKKGILASTNFYASTAHTNDEFEIYFNVLDEIFKKISKCEVGEIQIEDLIEGPICHSGFKRLN